MRRATLPSRGSPEALERAAGDTRTLIEEAAIALFYERGSQVTSVRDITKACSMTPGALYKHFKSREELLFELVRTAHEHVLRRLDAAVQLTGASAPDLKLAALVRALVLFHADHRREARVANQEYRFLPDRERKVILELRRHIRARLREVLVEGEHQGILHLPAAPGTDGALLAAVTICDMAMRVAEWYDESRPLSARDLAELHVKYVERMVGVDSPSTRRIAVDPARAPRSGRSSPAGRLGGSV